MSEKDSLIRFLFSEHGVRGEWVHLQQSLQQAKQYQQIANDLVDQQLGQALAAVVLLSATIKFDGKIILQIQGSGDLKALVAQASHDKKIRGLVRNEAVVKGENLAEMLGETSRMVITVESELSEPYQGIVAIEANDLAGILQNYFIQSEQLPTQLWLFANQQQAAGLFLQALPGATHDDTVWQHLQTLASTVTAEELFNLDAHELLHRLFHEEKVIVYPAETVEFACSCSRPKIANTLLALGRPELETILTERDDIEIDCQFCGARYQFDKIDVENLFVNPLIDDSHLSTTRH